MASRSFQLGQNFRLGSGSGKFRRTPKEFLDFVLQELGDEALRRVRPHVESQTLKDSLRVRPDPENSRGIILDTPYYWAEFAHYGRDRIDGKLMIWFENPKNDPRTDFGQNYPRVPRRRRLSDADYRKGLKINNARRKAARQSEGPYRPYMIVVRGVGHARANPFLDIGLAGFTGDAKEIIRDLTLRWVAETLDGSL